MVYLAFGVGALVLTRESYAQENDRAPAESSAISDSWQSVKLVPQTILSETSASRNDGPLFLSLYGSFVALQTLDLQSTAVALRNGHETNPVMSLFGGSTGLQIAAKAGATGAIIYVTERMRKRSRKAAIVTMIVLDSAYATIVAHNYAVGHP